MTEVLLVLAGAVGALAFAVLAARPILARACRAAVEDAYDDTFDVAWECGALAVEAAVSRFPKPYVTAGPELGWLRARDELVAVATATREAGPAVRPRDLPDAAEG